MELMHPFESDLQSPQVRDLFFAHSIDLLAIVGADGYFKRVNPAFERVLGYTEAELCSRPLTEFLHPDDVAKTKSRIKKLAGGSATIASRNRYRHKEGSYRWISWNTAPMGAFFYTIGRDITDQVNSEDQIRGINLELERENDSLEQAVAARITELQKSESQVQQLQKMDAIGRLAGGIAHDFNNMLCAISLYCDLVTDSDQLATIRENIANIRKVTERAAALTRQLLIFSRKQIVDLQSLNLNPIVLQLENMLTRLIGENIQIKMNLADDLDEVNADPSQIEQVILNLVVNARDAMPDGGTVTITTSNVYLDAAFSNSHLAVDVGAYVLLSVTDTGVGMDAETKARIFEPFFTTKPVGKGTGLGLSTTYGIIKQFGGSIWVYSEVGRGTVFKIYLPVAATAEKQVEPASEPIAVLRGTQTILLVEDDERLRPGFESVMSQNGYKVLVAANAAEALNILKNYDGSIDLLLTDVMIPGLNGFELTQKARELRSNLSVVYMSGYTNDVFEEAGKLNAGPLCFIQKPFGSKALLAKLRETLSRSS